MGGQRPFGTFPQIHPFWWGMASQSCAVDFKQNANRPDCKNNITDSATHSIGLDSHTIDAIDNLTGEDREELL